jgi:hypothetical protein
MSTQNIYPKDCAYGCNTRIYWNTAENTFFEVLSQKKHICPNSRKTSTPANTSTTAGNSYNYTRKPWLPKPKMSNSFELLQGSITEVQNQYEVLSDIVISNNGKVHGSQRDRDSKTGLLDLLVYYEVPEGKREEVKRKLN